ncbi:hypothetical protein ACJMK2_043919, partial [Sinanodonta woodiana]
SCQALPVSHWNDQLNCYPGHVDVFNYVVTGETEPFYISLDPGPVKLFYKT